MVVVDNTFLTLMLHPEARPPRDRTTKLPIERLDERIELLIETLDEDGETIIIPAPVLTEFLVLAGDDGPKYLTVIDQSRLFRVAPFDQRAAVELAALHLNVRASGGGRRGGQAGTYAKITFDRQIVAIARVNSVTTIYSDDDGVKTFAERYGIQVIQASELALPPEKHPLLRYAEQALLAGDSAGDTGEAKSIAGTAGIISTPIFPAVTLLAPSFNVGSEEKSEETELELPEE
jgi:predicted nucleic acid-binding protein